MLEGGDNFDTIGDFGTFEGEKSEFKESRPHVSGGGFEHDVHQDWCNGPPRMRRLILSKTGGLRGERGRVIAVWHRHLRLNLPGSRRPDLLSAPRREIEPELVGSYHI